MKTEGTKPRIAKGTARDHILSVAADLFYNNGIRAVGIDTIVAKSGVAKTTLYDHFPSKDDLVNAYLNQSDEQFWGLVASTLEKHPDQPKQQLKDLFEAFENMIATPESLGCMFLSTAAEFPELEQSGHQLAVLHKQKIRDRLGSLATAAGAAKSDQLADQLLLLLDGAYASKRVFRTFDSPTQHLSTAASMLIDLHIP